MKTFKILPFLLVLIFGLCNHLSAQTQGEMNDSAYISYKKTDAELNKVYQQLLKGLNKKEKKMLIETEKDWLKFRDSHCDFEAEENEGGSIQPLVWSMCMENRTKARIEDLKASINSRGL